MSEFASQKLEPRALVIADIEQNASRLIEDILKPAGIQAWAKDDAQAPPTHVIIVDVTQLRGDPLGGLRSHREKGDETPAIVLAAHMPANRLRDLFRLGVSDLLLKPFRPDELAKSVYDLAETRSSDETSKLLNRRLQTAREESRQRSEEIRMLSEIGRVVVSLDDLDEIMTRVVEAASFVTGAEEANIYIVEDDSDEVVLRASKAAGETRGTLPSLRITDTLAGSVYRSGQPILRQPELEGGPVKVQTGFLVQSLIKAPIRVQNQVVGVLGVYNRITQRRFSEHHLTLLMALANWTGVAIEHAHAAPSRSPGESTNGTEPVLAAPAELVQGLEEIQFAIKKMLDETGPPLDKHRRDELEQIRARLERLGNLPIALLDPERANELLDLPGLIMKVADELQLMAARKGLELIAEPSFPIPLFAGDYGRTKQVIEALVEKAIHRTRRGRVILDTHRFEVRDGDSSEIPLPAEPVVPDGMWAAVRVADTSAGLSPDTVHALSTESLDHKIGKEGPGLSMGEVKMIAASLSGILWYDQTPASTSITFALPIN